MAIAGVAVAALLAACSGSDGDETASASDRRETSWEDIEPCTLLSADALVTAGVPDAEGVQEAPPTTLPGAPGAQGPSCRWGERYDQTTAYVEVGLWDPPFPDLFDEDEFRQFEVAGRDAYSTNEEDDRVSCMIDVDNGDHFVHVNLEKASGEGAPACEVAASLASTALSAVA